MLAQQDYTPSPLALATLRQRVKTDLGRCPCRGTQQRILSAVNEIIANILRHSWPEASDIQVDFIDHDGLGYCVVRDDGAPFKEFKAKWAGAEMRGQSGQSEKGEKGEAFLRPHLGLPMIRTLWPQAFYIPRSEAFPYNSFILPLTEKGGASLPSFFHPQQDDWAGLIAPLFKRNGPGKEYRL